jgi:hypothetical protein
MDSQMPRMPERHLDQNTGRQHQNRDPRMEQIRQRRMAQTLGGNKMRKTTRITLAITVICMALAGCGSAPAHEVRSIDSQCSAWRGNLRECVITLTGTRKVDCVVYSSYQKGGLSCDWSHVSGADKELER